VEKEQFFDECFTVCKKLIPGFTGLVGIKVLIGSEKHVMSSYSHIFTWATLEPLLSKKSQKYLTAFGFSGANTLLEEFKVYLSTVGNEKLEKEEEEKRLQREKEKEEQRLQREKEKEEQRLQREKEREEKRLLREREKEQKKEDEKQQKLESIRSKFQYMDDSEILKGSSNVMSVVNRLIPIVTPFENEYKKGLLFYDPDTRKVNTQVNKEVFFMLKGIKPSEVLTSGVAVVGRVAFNPFIIDTRYLHNNELYFNLYNPPLWRFEEYKSPARIPPFIDKLLKHLFPDQKAREYVLVWIARALVDRNEIILCLIGARGTGKTLLARIISALVGEDYSNIASSSILDDKFNSIMKDNRLLILDEIAARSQPQVNKLKAFANVFIPMEAKGEDQQTVSNYNSMMILANEINSLAISPQERRFSVPEISDIDLRKSIPETEINPFTAILDDKDRKPHPEIVEFGKYLLETYHTLTEKYSNYTAFKGEHYYEVAKANMSEWQLYLEERLINGDEDYYAVPELAKDFRRLNRDLKFPVTSSTINNFLTDYMYKGKCRLGTLETGVDPDMPESTRFIVPNPELYKHVDKRSEDIL
jgi:energy-coupling factor transporter ATP-binding protein EcfA2